MHTLIDHLTHAVALPSDTEDERLRKAVLTFLAALTIIPGALWVYPGHGAGSLCGRSMQMGRSTTVEQERQSDPALQARSRD
jgi:hypothetical protein